MKKEIKNIVNSNIFIILGLLFLVPVSLFLTWQVWAAVTGNLSIGYRINNDEGNPVINAHSVCKRVYNMKDVPMDGLVAWFSFEDEAENYATDFVSTTLSGTYSYVTGRNGRAIKFGNGSTSGQVVLNDFGDYTLDYSGAVSVAFWISPQSPYYIGTGFNDYFRLGNNYYSSSMQTDNGYGNSIRLQRYSTVNGISNMESAIVMDGGWQHIVIISKRDTSGGTVVYKNGVLTGLSMTSYLMMGQDSYLQIGGPNTSYDDFGVWRRELSAAEITQLYNRVANPNDYFVPTLSDPEWTAFRSNLPDGFVIRDCYCGVGQYKSATSDTCVNTPAGYYSPANNPYMYPCGAINYYCPGGTDRQAVGAGYYASGGAAHYSGTLTMTSRVQCESSAYYCSGDGYKNLATSGYYTTPLSCTVGCTGQSICPTGYYCRNGWRTAISYISGYCGTPGQATCTTNGTGCDYRELAPAGKYAMQADDPYPGMCADCPAGKYGSSTGLKTSSCTGTCYGGYYCPAGSTSPTQNDCPSGSYCPDGSGSPISCGGGMTSPPNAYSSGFCITPVTINCDSMSRYYSCDPMGCSPADDFQTSTQVSYLDCLNWCESLDYYEGRCCLWNSSNNICSINGGTTSCSKYYSGLSTNFAANCSFN